MAVMVKIIGLGAVLGFLGAVGIFFDPDEPYPGFITAAGTLNGVVLSLLIGAAVTKQSSLGRAMLAGAGMGLLTSATVFLAKGGWESWDAPYVVPTDVVTGIILGVSIRWIRRKAEQTRG